MNYIVAAIMKLREVYTTVGYSNNTFEQSSFVAEDENISKI